MRFKNIDVVFLTILALSSLVSLLLHFISGYVLSINDYAGFLLLAIVSFFNFYGKGKFKSGLFILLTLGTFSIVGFSYVAFNSSFVNITDDITYNPPGFNPVLFLMLVVYIFINFDYIKSFLSGNKGEINADEEQMIGFYYNNFSEVTVGEFNDAVSRIEQYPDEAQVALRRLIDEKGV